MGVSRQHTLGIYCGLPGPGRVSWGSCVRWAAPRAEGIQLCLQIQLLPQGPSSAGSSVRGELLAPPAGRGGTDRGRTDRRGRNCRGARSERVPGCVPALIPAVPAMLREISKRFEVSDHRRNLSYQLGFREEHPDFLKVSVTGLRWEDAMLF